MANEQDHRAKADHNQRFLETISDQFPDWLAVVAFYKAVHVVEGLFATRDQDSRWHAERNNRLKRDYPAIWEEFYPLYNYSKLARYDCVKMEAAQIRRELIDKRLVNLEQLVGDELKRRRRRPRS